MMTYLRLLKSDKIVCILTVIGIPFSVLYLICMFIAPGIQSGWDWDKVQNIWDRWQSLNVGMLAFISSVIALSISRINAERQRERDFLASKAFLPQALSSLIAYFNESAVVLKQEWTRTPMEIVDLRIPQVPTEYKLVFQECIRHAAPDVGDYLSQILVKLQIHDARLRTYNSDDEMLMGSDKYNLISRFYSLAELTSMVNKLFGFARNMEKFDNSPLLWSDFNNAYANLEIDLEQIKYTEDIDLESFTKRAISRRSEIQ